MTTNNEDATLLVHAYVDGELDPANALDAERRIAADPALAAEHARVQALRDALREKVPAKPLPAHVRTRVMSAVGLNQARTRPSWQALAASVALALIVGSGATFVVTQQAGGDRIVEAVIDDHVRALMAPQPIDVKSTDRHTVKPWFNGRIPGAPRVVDLAQDGFPLVGGRIDVIGGTPVPTLVYQHNQHVISLTAVPATARSADVRRAIKGYNIVGWSDDGTAYWAVSDLGAADLDKFARAFRSASPDR